jgi:hypothetical protein
VRARVRAAGVMLGLSRERRWGAGLTRRAGPLQASAEGNVVGGRTVKGAHRPIQGGTGRRAMHNLAQLQEGVVQDSKDSPVEAVRAFIKRIAGKDQ